MFALALNILLIVVLLGIISLILVLREDDVAVCGAPLLG